MGYKLITSFLHLDYIFRTYRRDICMYETKICINFTENVMKFKTTQKKN